MHLGIDLSGINFVGLKGQNVLDIDDGVAIEAKIKVDDDDEIKDSTAPEDAEDTLDDDPTVLS